MKNNEFTNSTNCGVYKIFIITIICLAILLIGVVIGILQVMINCPYQAICESVRRDKQQVGTTTIIYDTEDINICREFQEYYNNLPEYLRLTVCKNIILTEDLSKYFNDITATTDGRITRANAECNIYICADEEEIKNTLYHELAHAIDHPNIADTKYSNTDSWAKIHRIEGDEIALEEYNFEVYSAMPKKKKLRESFAMAFAMYYCKPEHLSKYFPEMYEYMSNFTMRMENDNKIK